MLAEQTGAPTGVPGLLSYLTDRWDGHGPLGRGRHEEIPLAMRIVHVATDAALQRHLGGIEHTVSIVGERAGHAFDPEVAACLVEDGAEILAARRRRLHVGRDPGRRALAAADARGRCARTRPCRDGPLRRPDLAVLRRPLGGRRRACLRSRPPLPDRRPRGDRDRARRPRPRPRQGRGPRPGLAEARPVERRRVGAGAAAPVPHRTLPVAFAVPGGARPRRRSTPRAPRPKRLPPWLARCRPDDAGAAARRRRRLLRDVRAAAVPPSTRAGAGGGGAHRGGEPPAASTRTR